jgi:lipopolysaccharide transport system ATP-binding protein
MNWLSKWFRRPPPAWWILDDFFPNLLTGFRVAEYNALLDRFPGLRVASTYGDFDVAHARYAHLHPRHAHRIVRYAPGLLEGARLVYLNFLNNAVAFLPDLERARTPFVATLYPGGGFGLDESGSDAKLARLLGSPLLRSLIVTQDVTRAYVAARAPAHLPITEIFGVVANPDYFEPAPARTWFGNGKSACDVAFVAENYMRVGENKGFPAFVAAISALFAASPSEGAPDAPPPLAVHVVGSFDASHWRAAMPAGAPDPDALPLRFHGRLETSALRAFYRGVDVVVSPNLPRVLHAGNFDGFPTGCCVEGALCGVVMVASDPLGLNADRYRDGVEFIRVEPDGADVARALRALLRDPSSVARIGEAGCTVTRRLFAPEVQIGGRIAVLERVLRDAH